MLIRNFLRNENGNITMMFAGSMVAICSIVGISIDYSRVINQQQKSQQVLDASLLAAATEYLKTGSKIKAIEVGEIHMTASLPDLDPENLDIEVLTGGVLSGSYNGEMDNSFLVLLNKPTTAWSIESQVNLPSKATTDFALAIDVSNSMVINNLPNGDTLLEGLHDSLDEFSQQVYKNSTNGEVSVSVVPFANAVSFDSSYDRWLDSVNGYSQTPNFIGCFEYELIGSQNLLSTYGNSSRIAAFDRRKAPNGANVPFCPETDSNVAFYIDNENELSNKVSNLTTGQGTNTADGLTWAWRTLSTNWKNVFNESTVYPQADSENHNKVIILLTDGKPYAKPSVKGETLTKAEIQAAASAEFVEVCDQIIAAGDIDLYSIVYGNEMNLEQSSDIRNCIAGAGKTFWGTSEDELTSILSSIVTLNENLALSR